MKILVVQHEVPVHAASIEEWAKTRNHELTYLKIFEGQTFPKEFDFDGVVILGGSMGVYEKEAHPWIEKEEAWIRSLIEEEVPLLGICFGSQIIASAMGAKVEPMGYREMGWKEIKLTDEARKHALFKDFPPSLELLSWHGDISEIPDGSIPIGTSEACKNQGFIFKDKTLAVQFHPEANPSLLNDFIERYKDKFEEGGTHIQPAEKIKGEMEKHKEMNQHLFGWLDHLMAPDPTRF